MKPRERVMLALNHKEPDRIPIDRGNHHLIDYEDSLYLLKQHLGMPLEEIKMLDYVCNNCLT
jgi:hypothetical protein